MENIYVECKSVSFNRDQKKNEYIKLNEEKKKERKPVSKRILIVEYTKENKIYIILITYGAPAGASGNTCGCWVSIASHY